MLSNVLIRLVRPSDTLDILNIYTPFILNTTTSFETEIPSKEAFEERINQYSKSSPWLVAEVNGKVVGYAYATAHRSRKAYQWNQETTVYIDEDYRKMGIAKALYTKLLQLLQFLGYYKVIAVITLPNKPSIAFHQKLGFKHIGDMQNVGFKFRSWHTTSWWDLTIQNEDFIPSDIKPLKSIIDLI